MKKAFKDYPKITMQQLKAIELEISAVLMVSPSTAEVVFMVDNDAQLEAELKKADLFWSDLDYYDMGILGVTIDANDYPNWVELLSNVGVNVSTPCKLSQCKELLLTSLNGKLVIRNTDIPAVKELTVVGREHFLVSATPHDWDTELHQAMATVWWTVKKGRDYWANLIAWSSAVKEDHMVVLEDGRHILYNHELNKEYFTDLDENCEVMIRSLYGDREYFDTKNNWFLITGERMGEQKADQKVINQMMSFIKK